MNFTNFGEAQMVGKFRGTNPAYAASWYVALGSAADEGTFTELTGVNLARVAVTRSLLKFSGTQGDGTTVASNGTSHITSNNDDIQYGAAAANLAAPVAFVGLFDSLSGGNCWAYAPFPDGPLTVNLGDTPVIPATLLRFSIGLSGMCTSYLANKLVDEFFRAQAYAIPSPLYSRLYTVPANDAGVGTEVAGGSYARPSIAMTAGAWGAPSDGVIANTNALAFPAPTADWGAIAGDGLGDAASVGNLLLRKTYAVAKTVSNGGDPPTWAPGDYEIQLA